MYTVQSVVLTTVLTRDFLDSLEKHSIGDGNSNDMINCYIKKNPGVCLVYFLKLKINE